MFLSSNLKSIREKKRLSQEMVASAIGINRSTYSNYESGTAKNPDIMVLISLSNYFNISLDTLLKVNMALLSEFQWGELARGYDVHVSGSQLRVLTTTVDKKNKDNVEVVPIKSIAGYTTGYSDPEFIATLPTLQIPFLSQNKKYRAFQISGDSMHPIKSGAYIIVEFVQDWNTLKNGQACIVLTKDQGAVFKIVYNEIQEGKQLLLKSLNSFYKPYAINISEVMEVWQFITYFSNELPDTATTLEELAASIERLSGEVHAIRTNKKQ